MTPQADHAGNDLFQQRRQAALERLQPLPERMRPQTLDQFVGQAHLLAKPNDNKRPLLTRMLDAGRLTSIILHGPPGTGKTTLARVIANHVKATFIPENAAQIGVPRIREIIADARRRAENDSKATILFLDEIHRFSKAQQDVLLHDVERGIITLIGATTENPLFTVNNALVSRSTLFRLEPLEPEDIIKLIKHAIADPDRGLASLNITIDDDALHHYANTAEGDARRALAALEIAALSHPNYPNPPLHIDLATAEQSIQQKAIRYDRDADQHYDHASAIIKSIRGSDPDAALYWLATMLTAGEDPRFIARRLAILASEDIGNADPRAIMVADATWSLVERIGMPEARITLAQCVTYLALAPKSNASYTAYNAAEHDAKNSATIPVPLIIQDTTKPKSEGSPNPEGYQYSHNADTQTSIGGITNQSYLGINKSYYEPTSIGFDKVLAQRLAEAKAARQPISPKETNPQ